jgi:ABC-type transporter lipoprotein component MlaA
MMQTGSRGRRGVGFACALVAASAALACAHPVQRRDWRGYEGAGAEAFHAEEIDPPSVPDPIEPFNRSVSALNHFGIVTIASPVGHVYRLFVPRLVRESVRDFAANLLWPRNLFANLLQARWRAAGTETLRFGINTTVGLAGIWDPALLWWGIEPRPEDFGQVFGAWGWRPSTFLMLPFFGPSTPRDTVGLVPDTLLDPSTYLTGASSLLAFNELVDSIDNYERFVDTSFDAYDDTRVVWTIAREAKIDDEALPPSRGDDTGAVQTLESVFLAPRDAQFWHKLETGRAQIEGTGRALLYSYRLQPGNAPIVFLVPGLGTHRLGQSSLALAEMAWQRGFSVAIVSSALCFEFMLQAASVSVPGHAPMDARDLHTALTAVVKDLQGQHPDRLGKRVYMGYSLGAFHGFYLAAGAGEPDALPFERYVLLDPPVSLAYALAQLDRYYNAPLSYPPEQRAAEVTRIQRKAIGFAEASLTGDGSGDRSRVESADTGGSLEPSRELPFSDLEARYLIGLSFRRSLLSVLWISQQRHDLGVLLTPRGGFRRTSAYEEMADYSWSEYLYAFVLPYYRDQLHLVDSEAELVALNDLHAIADTLRGNPKLRVFLNSNDLITRSEEIEWLRDLVGPERVKLFPTGGHLGNLHAPDVQADIMDSIADLLP